MAKQPKKVKKSAKPKNGFSLDDLLQYVGNVTGKNEASGYANLGSKLNTQLTKTLPIAAQKTARGIDSFQTGGLASLGYDLATGKPMTGGGVAKSLGWVGLNYLPYGKLAKLAGPTYKTARSATESAKQLRLLYNLLNE